MTATQTKGKAKVKSGRSGKRSAARMRPPERDASALPPFIDSGPAPETIGARIPPRALDGFIVHGPDTFDPGKPSDAPLTQEQWDAARLLINQNYVLGFLCGDELDEALAIATAASVKFPQHVITHYDDKNDILWLAQA